MKQMSKEAQMQANGGAYVHCTYCGDNFAGLTSNRAKTNFMDNHKSSTHRFWDYGKFENCTNCK